MAVLGLIPGAPAWLWWCILCESVNLGLSIVTSLFISFYLPREARIYWMPSTA